MMRLGYYDFEGNTVLYEGGDEAYDLDSREWIPIELLIDLGEFIGEELGD